jgi:hypothetical protein
MTKRRQSKFKFTPEQWKAAVEIIRFISALITAMRDSFF